MSPYVRYVGTHLYDRQQRGGACTTMLTVGWLVLSGRTVNGLVSFSF